MTATHLKHIPENEQCLTFSHLEKLIPARLNLLFDEYFKKTTCPAPRLQEAMAYSVMNGGKRIRPLLVYATGQAFGASWENCDVPACAIELIHAYSLIHDDLPAMDNADMRRGLPACHKQYDEAFAILAGDTLQTLAFEVIAHHPADLNAQQRINMIKLLAQCSGSQGMGAGQALDMQQVNSIEALEEMYRLKTGALLSASLQLGAIAANVEDPKILNALKSFAEYIGLAFQIQDDLLDAQAESITGKSQGLDVNNNKMTYPMLIGLENTQKRIIGLFHSALDSISLLGPKATLFEEIARYLMVRKQ